MSRDCEPFLLAMKDDFSVINLPLKETQRIKYTCFNISANFLILGATSGSLYVFKRDPCTFLQLLPNKEGSITHIAITPNEKLFAFSTVKGMVCILERNAGLGARLIQLSRDHLNTEVTDLKWNTEGNELYVGDSIGRISVVNIILFTAKHMFNTPTFMLMQLDSRVVQLDWHGSWLLVSTITRCYLCNPHKEEYLQIGSKPRDGEYGACFLYTGQGAVVHSSGFRENRGKFSFLGFDQKLGDSEDLKDLKIFCARPGSRIWEVGVDGLVKNTHEFKHALAVKPSKIINYDDEIPNSAEEITWQPQSFNFSKLYIISNKFIFTFKSDGFYIFDPVKSDAVLWINSFKDIVDCKVVNDVIYLRRCSGQIVAISFSSLEKFLIGTYLCKNYNLCADICFTYQDYLISQVASCPRLHLLIDLHDKLPAETAAKISTFSNELSKCYVIEKQKSQRLQSGIFLVGNFHSLFLKKDPQELATGSSTIYKNDILKRSLSLSVCLKSCTIPEIPDRQYQSCPDLVSKADCSRPLAGLANGLLASAPAEPSSQSDYNDMFNTELDMLLPFTVMKSPEAIQALKDISSSVSGKITSGTKSLKEKWHVLEDKVKNLTHENQQELLDIKMKESDILSSASTIPRDAFKRDDIVHSKSNGVSKKVPYPKLETSKIIGLCLDIENCYSRGEDVSQQVCKFFDSVSTICKEYDPSSHSKSPADGSAIYFSSAVKMFPFTHYFPIQCHIIRQILLKSFETNFIIEWYKSLCLESVDTHLKPPEYIRAIHSPANINTDAFISNILLVFTELIDAEAIIEELKKTGVPCYYITLITVLNLLEDGALQISKSEGQGKWPLPLQLNAMFCVLRMGQPETCSKMGESVDLKDVLYLILRLQTRLAETGIEWEQAVIKCQTHFLAYIDNISDDAIIEAALTDSELSRYIIDGFEFLNSLPQPEMSCECGFPLPRSAMQVSHFPRIGEIICKVLWTTDRKELSRISSHAPGMWCFIMKNRRRENPSELLPLLIHVGAVSEFEFLLSTFDQSLWERAINLLAKYQTGHCLNCERTIVDFENLSFISWTELGMLIVKSLGAAKAIELLLKFESFICPGKLDASFYQRCLLSKVVERYVPGLGAESVSAVLAENLFGSELSPSGLSSQVSPQLLSARPVSINGSHHTEAEKSGACADSKPWGLCLDLGQDVCVSCCLPLRTRALLHDGGLTSFRCGHTYHSICMKARANFCCLRCTAT